MLTITHKDVILYSIALLCIFLSHSLSARPSPGATAVHPPTTFPTCSLFSEVSAELFPPAVAAGEQTHLIYLL